MRSEFLLRQNLLRQNGGYGSRESYGGQSVSPAYAKATAGRGEWGRIKVDG